MPIVLVPLWQNTNSESLYCRMAFVGGLILLFSCKEQPLFVFRHIFIVHFELLSYFLSTEHVKKY